MVRQSPNQSSTAKQYEFVPITLREANAFVARYHRHNKPTVSHKFSIGLKHRDRLIGVGIAGRPVARLLDDGVTLELNRVCVKPGHPNACSKLLARLKRIGQLFGYTSIKTYTLRKESGASLRAVGAGVDRRVPPQTWDRPNRPSPHQPVYDEEKLRWELLPKK